MCFPQQAFSAVLLSGQALCCLHHFLSCHHNPKHFSEIVQESPLAMDYNLNMMDMQTVVAPGSVIPKKRVAANRVQSTCVQCRMSFPTARGLEIHAKDFQHEAWICRECPVRFKDRSAFSKHKSRHKNPDVMHPCSNCNHVFKRKDNLIEHQSLPGRCKNSSTTLMAEHLGLADLAAASSLAPIAETSRPQQQLDSLLVEAVLRHDWHDVSYLLGQGADPHVKIENFPDNAPESGHKCWPQLKIRPNSVLTVSAQCGQLHLCKLLLRIVNLSGSPDSDNDINPACDALVAAAANGHLEIVTLLLDYSTAVNSRRWLTFHHHEMPCISLECTALIASLKGGHKDIAMQLLNAGADATVSTEFILVGDSFKFSPLTLAAQKGYIGIASSLLENGATLDEAASSLDDYFCSNTPLFFAAMRGHSQLVNLFLDRGANPLIEGQIYGVRPYETLEIDSAIDCTPLFAASMHGHTNVAASSIDHGASINAEAHHEDDICGTALFVATRNEHTDLVKMLCGRGADTNVKGAFREPFREIVVGDPLMMALQGGHINTARFLIDNGAAIDTKVYRLEDKKVMGTSLHVAAVALSSKGGHRADATAFLLENGADLAIKGLCPIWDDFVAHGTAMIFAITYGGPDTVELLIDHGANPDEHVVVSEVDLQNSVDDSTFKTTALILAIANDMADTDIVEVLLRKGANPNIWGAMDLRRGFFVRSPLYAAVAEGEDAIVENLLQYGAIVDEQTEALARELTRKYLAYPQGRTMKLLREAKLAQDLRKAEEL